MQESVTRDFDRRDVRQSGFWGEGMNAKAVFLSVVLSLAWAMPGLLPGGGKAVEPALGEPIEVELFAAARSGQIQLAVVPQSYSLMTLRVRNNTSGTLRVLLPEYSGRDPHFALADTTGAATKWHASQPGPTITAGPRWFPRDWARRWRDRGPTVSRPAGRVLPTSHAAASRAPRTWTLAAREMIQIQVPCFCLEYGKPDPNRRIPYQVVELQDLNDQPAVQELLKRFGQGDLDQRIAQLAAWHVANGVPWQMLAQVKFPRTQRAWRERSDPARIAGWRSNFPSPYRPMASSAAWAIVEDLE